MTSENNGEAMPLLTQHDIDSDAAVFSPAAKPKGGARLLSLILRITVMHIAFAFFFLFAGAVSLIFVLQCIASRIFRCRRRRRPFPQPEAERRGLSPEEIHCLPCFRCSEQISVDCAVCLEGFKEGDLCRVLPSCTHLFHTICIDRWLERAKVCPNCRGTVSPDSN